MWLEKVFILEAVMPTAEHALPEADSLSGHRYQKELAAALNAACKYEQKHNLSERWSQDTAEYQQAMQERKGYWVDRLQGSIAADLDALHVSKLAAGRISRQHRSTSSSLKKHARATRIRLEKSIQQL